MGQGDETEELRGNKRLCAIAACKAVSLVAAVQCWWVSRVEALLEPPPMKVSS